ncbi:hypothetical protein D3C86_1505860 [compost metagenome]
MGKPSGLNTRNAPQARTSRTSRSKGKVATPRLAIAARTSVEVPSSKPTSSIESPSCTVPSSVWRTLRVGYSRKGRSRSLINTCPRLGATGAYSPTCRASAALPSPAARTMRGATKLRCPALTRNSPGAQSMRSTCTPPCICAPLACAEVCRARNSFNGLTWPSCGV